MNARTYVLPEGDASEIVNKLAKEYKALIQNAAQRYTIEGKYDTEDAEQECITLLWEMLCDGWDPTTVDFRKLYKTRMWHRLMDRTNWLTRPCRDCRRNTTLYFYRGTTVHDYECTTVDGEDLSRCDNPKYSSRNPKHYAAKWSPERDPADIAEEKDFIEVFMSKLEGEELQVFTAILSDIMDDGIEDIREALARHFDKHYEADQMRRKQVPMYVYAEVTGLEQKVVHRCVQGLRHKYSEFVTAQAA